MPGSVLEERRGLVEWITLNRPEKLNVIDAATVDALLAAVERAEKNDETKAIVLTGAGNRAFCAGYDMNDEVDHRPATAAEWRRVLEHDSQVTTAIWEATKPTIAAVNGYCLGGGCELAMACDMIIATPHSQFGEPEIRFGSGPVTLLMPFVLGEKKTKELLLTGDHIGAEEAWRVGLINRIVEEGDLVEEVTRLAHRICPTPLPVLRLTKQAINRAYQAMGIREAIDANLDISSLLNGAETPEQQEFDRIARSQGLKAALEWRDARYGEPT